MGLFSSIKKGIKKIAKGVGKIFKKVGKGIKKFASSKLGKVAMIGAAVFTGGIALGAWGAPAWMGGVGTAMEGALVPGAGAGAGAGAGTAVSTAPASTALSSIAEAGVMAPNSVVTAGGTAGLGTAGNAAMGAAQTAATQAGIGSTIADVGSKIWEGTKAAGAYMKDNPMATYVGGQMLQSALAEDPVKQQLRLEKGRREASNIYGVSGTGEGTPLAQTGFTQPAQPPQARQQTQFVQPISQMQPAQPLQARQQTQFVQPMSQMQPSAPVGAGLISQAENPYGYSYEAPQFGYQRGQYG